MGYSTPKKQFDLKEFLSQPAKKPVRRMYRNRTRPVPVERSDSASASPTDSRKPK